MIDITLVLKDKDAVKKSIGRKGYDVSRIDELESFVLQSRKLQRELEELRRQRNVLKDDQTVSVEQKRQLRDQIVQMESEASQVKEKLDAILYDVPNFPDDDAPDGLDAESNVVIEEASEYYKCPVSKPQTHWEIGKKLNILDNELATKISGSKFALYIGKGSQLLRALVSYALKTHGAKYLEITPPHMVTSKTLGFTGHLPKFADEQYKAIKDDLWLIPTAEVPLTGCFAQTTFEAGELPQYRMGYTVCFRREAGSVNIENKGLQRIHEFHKVELVKIVEPQMKDKELADLLKDCLIAIKALKLQYRVVDLCAGDMGDKYGRCYDIEVYAPGVKKWLEVSSVGHFSDYQARRAGIKYKTADGEKKFAYTLNGSGLATPRVLAAIIETYQQSDGSIVVPEVLRPYMDCDIIK